MAITNGYTTLANVLALLAAEGEDPGEDAMLEGMIEAASRLFDGLTRRTFYARTETRYHSVPERNAVNRRRLWLDDDLLSATSITNGDGTAIAASDYYFEPRNGLPACAVVLKQSAGVVWTGDADGNTEYVIPIAGSWGYSASAPADVREEVEGIVVGKYRNRYGTNVQGAAQITAAGVVITPQDIPASAWKVIEYYRRIV
jgi:hypothetical protein